MIKAKEINNKKIWEGFVLNNPEGNFLQSWSWGSLHQALGNKIFRLGFFDKEKLKGISLLIKQTAKRGAYLECPAGPLIDWSKPELFKIFVAKAREIGETEGCCFARVRPQILANFINKNLFRKNGFLSAPLHLHAETTWQLDLNKNEEQLLREMRKTTRNLIKKAIREKIRVEQSLNPKDINVLYKLQLETASRHHFVPFSKKYFLEEFKAFASDDQIRIFKSIYRKQVLAIALIIFYGQEAVYHYSASSFSYPKIPASYALQWEAIKEAKKRKCKTYNLWGIAPTNNPRHRFAGVTIFKKGFGGQRVDYLQAQDLPLKSSYWLVYLFEKIRKIYRRL